MEVKKMGCLYCDKNCEPNDVGGLLYIECCNEIQVSKSSVRTRLKRRIEEELNTLSEEDIEEILSSIHRTNVL